MLAFQVKVVAQEKAPLVTTSIDEEIKFAITIDKDATDEELNEGAEVFKEEFGTEVIVNKVTRNSTGEITTIKLTVKDKNQSKDYSVIGNDPINPFTIEIAKNSNSDENTIAFGNSNNNTSVAANTINYTSTNTKKFEPKVITLTSKEESTKSNYGPAIINPSKGSLVIVNGVKQENNTDATQLQLPKGQSISYMNVLSPKEAKKKYGREAKKGAVEITTKKGSVAAPAFPQGFTYNMNDEGNSIGTSKMPPMPPMPPMEDLIAYASMGVEEGMKALSNMDWQKVMAFEGLTEEDRREIQEEMENASIEIRKAFNDPEVRKVMASRKQEAASLARGLRDGALSEREKAASEREMIQAKKELIEAKKELEKAKLELIKAQKEIEKSKADAKRKSN